MSVDWTKQNNPYLKAGGDAGEKGMYAPMEHQKAKESERIST